MSMWSLSFAEVMIRFPRRVDTQSGVMCRSPHPQGFHGKGLDVSRESGGIVSWKRQHEHEPLTRYAIAWAKQNGRDKATLDRVLIEAMAAHLLIEIDGESYQKRTLGCPEKSKNTQKMAKDTDRICPNVLKGCPISLNVLNVLFLNE